MFKTMRYTLLAIAVLACKKKTDNAPGPLEPSGKTPKELLNTGSWEVVQTVYSAMNQNYVEKPSACEADNVLTFQEDGLLLKDEGAVKCKPDAPQTSTEPYILTEDGKKITLTFKAQPITASVEELSDTKFVYSFTQSIPVLGMGKATVEYKRK